MFDVLDSVESALTHGSSSLGSSSAAVCKLLRHEPRGGSPFELARLQRELADLERQVFGSSEAPLLSAPTLTAGASAPLPPPDMPPPDVMPPQWATAAPHNSPWWAAATAPAAAPPPDAAPPWWTAHAAVTAVAQPLDVAPSTPPRRSRELDLGGLWSDTSLPGSPAALTVGAWPAAPRLTLGTAAGPRLEEIDDVLALLCKAPPEAAQPAARREGGGGEVSGHRWQKVDAAADQMQEGLGSQFLRW